MRDKSLLVMAGTILGVWTIQSLAGTFDPTLRPDSSLTQAVGLALGGIVAALVAIWVRQGKE